MATPSFQTLLTPSTIPNIPLPIDISRIQKEIYKRNTSEEIKMLSNRRISAYKVTRRDNIPSYTCHYFLCRSSNCPSLDTHPVSLSPLYSPSPLSLILLLSSCPWLHAVRTLLLSFHISTPSIPSSIVRLSSSTFAILSHPPGWTGWRGR